MLLLLPCFFLITTAVYGSEISLQPSVEAAIISLGIQYSGRDPRSSPQLSIAGPTFEVAVEDLDQQ